MRNPMGWAVTMVLVAAVTGCGGQKIEGDTDASEDGATDSTSDGSDTTRGCDDCDDSDPCTVDSCDEVADECVHEPVDGDGDGFSAMLAPDGTTVCAGDDCNDEDDTIYPGAPEVCLDGVDQDCDTIVDGPRAMLTSLHLKMVSSGTSPSLVWMGSEFAVVWEDARDIYMGRVGLDGDLIGDPARLTELRWSLSPSIAWTGSALGLVFYNNMDHDGCTLDTVDCFSDIHFVSVSPTAELVGEIIALNDVDTVGIHPKISWTGSEFGVFWNDGRDGPCPTLGDCDREIYFCRVGVDGQKIGTERRITDHDGQVWLGSADAGRVWTGTEYMIPWRRSDTTSDTAVLSRVSPDGSVISNQVVDKVGSIMWSGSEFGMTWHDDISSDFDVYMGYVDQEGNVSGSTTQITDDVNGQAFPSIFWTGSSYGIFWLDGRDTGCSPLPVEFDGDCHAQIYMQIVDPDGETLWDDVQLTWRDSWKITTKMAWTGSEFGLAWFEVFEDERYISFDRISFCE